MQPRRHLKRTRIRERNVMLSRSCLKTQSGNLFAWKQNEKVWCFTSLSFMRELIGVPGLIIQNAVYGVAEMGDTAENIWLDVTTPMQALVRRSQLHIPGGDTKVMDEILFSIAFSHHHPGCFAGFLRPCTFRFQVFTNSLCVPWAHALHGDS